MADYPTPSAPAEYKPTYTWSEWIKINGGPEFWKYWDEQALAKHKETGSRIIHLHFPPFGVVAGWSFDTEDAPMTESELRALAARDGYANAKAAVELIDAEREKVRVLRALAEELTASLRDTIGSDLIGDRENDAEGLRGEAFTAIVWWDVRRRQRALFSRAISALATTEPKP